MVCPSLHWPSCKMANTLWGLAVLTQMGVRVGLCDQVRRHSIILGDSHKYLDPIGCGRNACDHVMKCSFILGVSLSVRKFTQGPALEPAVRNLTSHQSVQRKWKVEWMIGLERSGCGAASPQISNDTKDHLALWLISDNYHRAMINKRNLNYQKKPYTSIPADMAHLFIDLAPVPINQVNVRYQDCHWIGKGGWQCM